MTKQRYYFVDCAYKGCDCFHQAEHSSYGAFENDVFKAGWVLRGLSPKRWYCPEHRNHYTKRSIIMLTLPLPPSVNHYLKRGRNGKSYLSDEAQTFKQEVALICNSEGVEPFTGEVVVIMRVYRQEKRGDLDNFAKLTWDALQGYCYLNDKQIVESHAYRHDDKANPRIEIEVREAK